MAGRYPYHMGLAYAVIANSHPFGLPLNQTTIANELKKGGYSTHAVGKWDLGMFKWGYTPTYRGFDTFYGYYSAGEDYYTHSVGKGTQRGIDFRNNTEPVTDKKGYYIYSTNFFTEAVQEAIEKHDSDKAPFFIYAAYQAVHDPLEAPQEYIDQCQSIPYENRRIFCGMLKAADEGISNITMLLKEKNLLDDTISLYLVQTMEVRLQQVVAIGH